MYQNAGKAEYEFIQNVDTETGDVDYKKPDEGSFIDLAESLLLLAVFIPFRL